jgi:hypothetical protein
VVYSDGSLQNEQAGAGYYITRGPKTELHRGSIGLGNTATVYDAEIIGASLGLQAAMQNSMAKYATDITICLNNEEAAIHLHTEETTKTSAAEIQDFTRFDKALQDYWAVHAPARYNDLRIRASALGRPPKELYLPRPILGRLLATRSGHGVFHDYHIRFEHENAVLECSCGAYKSSLMNLLFISITILND